MIYFERLVTTTWKPLTKLKVHISLTPVAITLFNTTLSSSDYAACSLLFDTGNNIDCLYFCNFVVVITEK